MQAVTLRAQAGVLRAAPQARLRRSVRAAASSSDVPPNVQEARAWIAAWKAKQQGSAKPASSAGNGAVAPKGKPEGPKGKLGPSKSFSDGTLLFTADSLSAVQYKDIKLKAK